MKFQDYKYERPDVAAYTSQFRKKLEEFKNAESFDVQRRAMEELIAMQNRLTTSQVICSIRHSVDMNDEFYNKENDFFDEEGPNFQALGSEYYKALVDSKFKDQLTEKFGMPIFDKAHLSLKVFDPKIIPLLQKENKLVSDYSKLMAGAKIEFDGKINNLSQMAPYMQSMDRDVRKSAGAATTGFFVENEAEIDRIYHELVQTRNEMAVQLGYKNFVQMGYDRMQRADYNAADVANYRKQVYEDLVPISQQYRKKQAARLGLDHMYYYDEGLSFKSGNPTPKGEEKYLVDEAKKMYAEMSPETDEFFTFMTDRELLSLTAKQGKAGGGYCTFMPDYKSPFIFSNFNGTAGDVDVLTHEAGHAFQVYCARNMEVPEYVWPTYEACEIHSMSMEFFAWPWTYNFFKEDTDKYKFSHLTSALLFIPYGVTVDEFQHFVYENPSATPDERKAKWREIESKYLPHRDYEDNKDLDRGIFWFRQAHIFASPFYYIDYTLAQVCALQFWHKSQQDWKKAFKDYIDLCKLGGSQHFLSLVESAGLKNPFVSGTIKGAVEPAAKYLSKVDDSKF